MTNLLTVMTYAPSEVRLDIGGYVVTGWETISISPTRKFNSIKGIRGKHSRTKNLDTSATIVVPLMQTSQSNDVFTEIVRQDGVNGTGRIALTLKDNSGNAVFSSDEAYIVGYPDVIYADDIELRAWTIFCQTTAVFAPNGNGKASELAYIFSSAYQAVTNLF